MAASRLRSAWQSEDRQLRVATSRAGAWLVALLLPAGFLLDAWVYPQQQGVLAAIRGVATALIFVLLALHGTAIGRTRIRALCISYILAANAAIAAMIAVTEGAVSPYYAGLSLVLMGMGVHIPFTAIESAVVVLATLALYLAACLVRGDAGAAPAVLFNNAYFIVLTGVLAVTASWFGTRRRVQAFVQRQRIERQRVRLDRQREQIAASYDQLQAADAQRRQFLSAASHELRTPLTLILAPIEQLLSGGQPLPDAVAEALYTARQNGRRLLKLVNDLLDLVRIDAGTQRLKLEPVALGPFAASVCGVMQTLAGAKEIELACHGADAGAVVDADRTRLETVLLNLLSNAIKFTPRGGRIAVRVAIVDDLAELTVSDTGTGIPTHELPHVFERFRQVDGSTTRRYQGIGIGLSLGARTGARDRRQRQRRQRIRPRHHHDRAPAAARCGCRRGGGAGGGAGR